MKQKLIDLMILCDVRNSNVVSSPQLSPSSSIEEIAEYIVNFLKKEGNI